MLPDYPQSKEKIRILYIKRLKTQIDAQTRPFDQIRPSRMFEGDHLKFSAGTV